MWRSASPPLSLLLGWPWDNAYVDPKEHVRQKREALAREPANLLHAYTGGAIEAHSLNLSPAAVVLGPLPSH